MPANREGHRAAVAVNGMSEADIDAAPVSGRGGGRPVEPTNGCICRTLRDDLPESVGALARESRFDTILTESTGISEPMPVAAPFECTVEDGTSLSDHPRLDTTATVVDATNFLPELERGDRLDERDLAAAQGSEWPPPRACCASSTRAPG
ncbi:GTP-binding protein [Actinosynnema sp. NPDC023587]|uniref:GTP-binding protein n=1 Tax=Actinosynnema sp. NPDC023587 TaxID=3154695 RepID=UPI0033E6A1D0